MATCRANISEAKTHLSTLVEAAAAGEGIILCRNGPPFVPFVAHAEPEVASLARGFGNDPSIVVADDVDDSLPDEMLASFSA